MILGLSARFEFSGCATISVRCAKGERRRTLAVRLACLAERSFRRSDLSPARLFAGPLTDGYP